MIEFSNVLHRILYFPYENIPHTRPPELADAPYVALVRQHQGSLVQRELSAKLTEGLLHRSIDILAHAPKVSADFVVRDTNNPQSIALQISRACGILFHILFFIVLRTIQLDHQFRFRTVEVCNIIPQHLLP